MPEEPKQNWTITVYEGTEKINSCSIKNKTKAEANKKAKEWIDKFYSGYDWSLHCVS